MKNYDLFGVSDSSCVPCEMFFDICRLLDKVFFSDLPLSSLGNEPIK